MSEKWITGKYKWVILVCLILTLGYSFYKFVYNRPYKIPEIPPQGLALSDFQFLKKGMTFDKIVKTVGRADQRLGGGGQILIYNLADGGKLVLNFDMFKFKLQEAVLAKSNNTEEILIK